MARPAIALTARGRELEGETDTLREQIAATAGLESSAFAALRGELRALHARLAGIAWVERP